MSWNELKTVVVPGEEHELQKDSELERKRHSKLREIIKMSNSEHHIEKLSIRDI